MYNVAKPNLWLRGLLRSAVICDTLCTHQGCSTSEPSLGRVLGTRLAVAYELNTVHQFVVRANTEQTYGRKFYPSIGHETFRQIIPYSANCFTEDKR